MCLAPFCPWQDEAPKQTAGKTIEMPQCHIAPNASNERKATGTNENVHNNRRRYMHTAILKKFNAFYTIILLKWEMCSYS